MIRRVTLVLCAVSMPALADTLPGHPELSVTQQDGPVVAVVTLDNFPGGVPGEHTAVIKTRLGPVTVLHTVTPNAPRGCCADFLEVIDGPTGTIAYPWRIEVAEGATDTIEIREWSGM